MLVAMLFFSNVGVHAEASNPKDMQTHTQNRSYISADDPGWNRMVDPEVCAAMKFVGIARCSENNFTGLSGFLDLNGKSLVTKDMIGKPTKVQNRAIADAIRRNAALFADGNLTAAAAARWRM